jgi:predicted trehalose synthase
VPRPFGAISINIDGKNLPLMLFSEFIESIGDGGTYFWGNINEQLKSWGSIGKIEPDPLKSYCKNLGEIVSDFHYHSAIIEDDFFTPEILTQDDIAKWKAHIEELFRIAYQNCNDILLNENPAQSVLDLLEPFLQNYLKLESWDTLEGTLKIKIHQDLHLSQMLTSSSSNGLKFVIIDFEGDPMLPPEDKFQKDPIFRDLAAICSAFHYIKFNALAQYAEQKLNINAQKFNELYLQLLTEPKSNSQSENSPLTFLIPLAQEWQTQCQQWFIESYLYQSNNHKLALNLDFLNFSEFERMLFLFRIERLIKELYYESLFRKSNAIIPTIGLLEHHIF